MVWPDGQVLQGTAEDALEAPEEEFIELATWVSEARKKMELDDKAPDPKPEDLGLTVEVQPFRGSELRGETVMTGQRGHFKKRKRDIVAVKKKDILDDGQCVVEENQ